MSKFKDSWGKAKILLSQLLCIGAVFTACTDDEVVNQTDKAPLQVSVNTSLAKQSRSIVHGEWLPAGSTIGVSLFDTEGDYYDGQGYYNIQYKATGAEEDQTWSSMGVTPAVSANEAVLVAYHPYNDDEDLDIFAMPVEIASQTDYMYSGPVTGITNAAPKADIVLDHALTAIRVKLVLGDFTGDASVSEIAVASSALASTATLNAADGSLDNIAGQGDKFALPVDFELVAGGTDNDIMFVPDASVESGVTTVSTTIGGKKYTAGIEFDQAYKQGYIYTYTLTLNNSGFAVTKVNVNPWEPGTDDSAVLQPEKDNAYIIKIVASYNEVESESLFSGRSSSEYFQFCHNMYGFIGTIDWGDGTMDTYDEPVDWYSHEYKNDGTEYTITAKGTITRLFATSDSFRQSLKEIIHIGDCGITSMNQAFVNCGNITTIPQGLFDYCTEVTDFKWTFQGCTGLITIPEGLFDHCTKVTTFGSTFSGCTGLTTIPEGLFDHCTEVTDFSYAFANCYSLQAIPVGLFDHCTEVTNFARAFNNCVELTSIPIGLFDNCRVVANFNAIFTNCAKYMGESPYTIINIDGQDIKIHLYERENYPEYFTITLNIYSCFSGCTGLTDYNNIPEKCK